MLYLPPRLAHFGIAEDDCMTYSVGFRAPSAAEVLTHFTDFLSQYLPDEDRYTDADAQPVSDPHQIQRDALDRLKEPAGRAHERRAHAADLVRPVHDRATLSGTRRRPRRARRRRLLGSLEQGAVLIRNPSARLAWSEVDDDLLAVRQRPEPSAAGQTARTAENDLCRRRLAQSTTSARGWPMKMAATCCANWSNKEAWGSLMNKIHVRVADWQKDNAELRRIREAVFIAEQSVPPELEWDADDSRCRAFSGL
jgi:ribosomal protein L16 Arg81 hydroxylase